MRKDKFLTELKEIVQSSNVNFLLGAGTSSPFLPLLGNIEKEINKAIEGADIQKQVEGYKNYLEKVMLPAQTIITGNLTDAKHYFWDKDKSEWEEKDEESIKKDYSLVKNIYEDFIRTITKLISERETTILNKQINIFTTNIDPFIEFILEELYVDYNDGFYGRINPNFSLSNFKKSMYQRSLHFDHKSEIPIINLFKVHGSLTWRYEKDTQSKDRKILLSSDLKHFDEKLSSKDNEDFIKEYKEKILVVNPENAKFSETVLNKYYYELLRSYSSELEKENSVLFIIGFSMEDQHIREITLRAAKSNPTLRIFIFLHDPNKRSQLSQELEIEKYPNIAIAPNKYEDVKSEYTYTLEAVTSNFLGEINFKSKDHGQNRNTKKPN